MSTNRYEDDDEVRDRGGLKIPDRDFFRKNFSTFGSVYNHFHHRLFSYGDNQFEDQPHFCSLVNIRTSYSHLSNPADGVCCHFLRRGFTKPIKVSFNCAVWSADSRWLVLGTQNGDLALWEAEALKVHKVISIPAHKEYFGDGDRIKEQIPITAMAWQRHGNLLVTGDNRGVMQYCDETFHNVSVTKDAHSQAIRGLSFSPMDNKLVSCSDDGKIHIWAGGRDKPEQTFLGHLSDIKSVDWHPYRSLIASSSRDATIKLWDPKEGCCVSTISGHKRQVNSVLWNMNGNWLASGSTDGLIKIYDIRKMKEMEVLRGQNSEVCRLAWHPIHESLLVSGGYNGSLVYWIVDHNQSAHSIINDAHRQSIDLLAWHPSGNLLASASHDCILKFWCREPAGSKLDPPLNESTLDTPPVYMHGPMPLSSHVLPNKFVSPTQSGGTPLGNSKVSAGPSFFRSGQVKNRNNPVPNNSEMPRKRPRESV